MSVTYVMINTVPDKMEVVLKEIREIEGVEEAYMVYGVYDIITEVKVGDDTELKDTILKIRILKHSVYFDTTCHKLKDSYSEHARELFPREITKCSPKDKAKLFSFFREIIDFFVR